MPTDPHKFTSRDRRRAWSTVRRWERAPREWQQEPIRLARYRRAMVILVCNALLSEP